MSFKLRIQDEYIAACIVELSDRENIDKSSLLTLNCAKYLTTMLKYSELNYLRLKEAYIGKKIAPTKTGKVEKGLWSKLGETKNGALTSKNFEVDKIPEKGNMVKLIISKLNVRDIYPEKPGAKFLKGIRIVKTIEKDSVHKVVAIHEVKGKDISEIWIKIDPKS